MEINLNTCIAGQKLKSKHGMILTYLGKNSDLHYPHDVQYPSGGRGTRTDDGHVFLNNRMEGDQDIVEILPLKEKSSKDKFTIIYRQYYIDCGEYRFRYAFEYVATDNLTSVLGSERFKENTILIFKGWNKQVEL